MPFSSINFDLPAVALSFLYPHGFLGVTDLSPPHPSLPPGLPWLVGLLFNCVAGCPVAIRPAREWELGHSSCLCSGPSETAQSSCLAQETPPPSPSLELLTEPVGFAC